jgi:glycerol uptake facilitator-like aquaporin
MFGPISGAHFNPAVSVVFALKKELPPGDLANYVLAQIGGGIAGVLVAHGMFDETLFQLSTKARSAPAQWLSEGWPRSGSC